jgi:hypothetical protein
MINEMIKLCIMPSNEALIKSVNSGYLEVVKNIYVNCYKKGNLDDVVNYLQKL